MDGNEKGKIERLDIRSPASPFRSTFYLFSRVFFFIIKHTPQPHTTHTKKTRTHTHEMTRSVRRTHRATL